jgi:hypothetical protein
VEEKKERARITAAAATIPSQTLFSPDEAFDAR